MYDDLARSQRPSSLEWLVVHTVIPSVLLTLVFGRGAVPTWAVRRKSRCGLDRHRDRL